VDLLRPGFEEWYRQEHDALVRSLLVIAGDREVAGDAVAEAFSRALARWDHVRSLGNPTGWVYRVALNHLRRRGRRAALEARLLRRHPAATMTAPAEVVPELWAAISRLPLRQREAIALRYVGDRSEREVAEAMGIAEGTASATLAAARRRLAGALEHLEGAPWT
jgi:RNA polymerase sigma-70 factor (ECF subfamily)